MTAAGSSVVFHLAGIKGLAKCHFAESDNVSNSTPPSLPPPISSFPPLYILKKKKKDLIKVYMLKLVVMCLF